MATNVNRNRIFHFLNLETLESHPAPVIPDDRDAADDSPTLAAVRKLLRDAESLNAIGAVLDIGGSGVSLSVEYSTANVKQLATKSDEIATWTNGHLVSAGFKIKYTRFHDAEGDQSHDPRQWAIEQLTAIATRAMIAAANLQRHQDTGDGEAGPQS